MGKDGGRIERKRAKKSGERKERAIKIYIYTERERWRERGQNINVIEQD